ncbi:flagellar biosynthesis anti-sigma factor FlgM [Sphingosinicella sp. CPCC 101087]|uniref:flagellar biosynthesis anti-sigma factor FlgM n=1 Tax=Sphingosinicella sp. CPCC 101087 TaxID=2497754 RepID=UPI00101B7568|nr:flagellar biosynthesis anti-sigma factor FlgM [Sphingosinicella sp. CPCC 101087]
MIDGVGKSGPARIDLNRSAVGAAAPAAKTGHSPARGEAAGAGAAVADLAAGPPVDSAKVAAIRAAIAEGRYPVDPLKIAERMIEIDMPGRA